MPAAAQVRVCIDRPREFVFAYFADLRNEPVWNRGHVQDVVMTSTGAVGLGSTFEGRQPGFGKATWRITAFEPPKHIAIEGLSGSAPYRYIGDLEPHGASTISKGRIEWEPSGPWLLMGPALSWILKLQAVRSFRRLRFALEHDGR